MFAPKRRPLRNGYCIRRKEKEKPPMPPCWWVRRGTCSRVSVVAGQLRDGGYRKAMSRTPLSVPGESVVIQSRNPARGSSGTGNHHPRKGACGWCPENSVIPKGPHLLPRLSSKLLCFQRLNRAGLRDHAPQIIHMEREDVQPRRVSF
ncbi:hypothetical protein LX32DRAFT_284289 [Colletotrichum zoysiae]|uniref:Uncharacterized protein n=1 Tax=Colletotrichum zoysiae TaxID=1216348 RepID=A0AAD9M795_9PEZI|nr:hypothetical protein LX32DRAFT_284289 [Colletotrichum zoysiae]